ncbi:MAG: CPBP family intramembrane glutamic endopeptidase [Spirulinaceae cyanobacterium]
MPFKINTIATYPVLVRLVVFLSTLVLIWLPFAIPIYFTLKSDSNLLTIVVMGILFIEFLFLLPWWGKKVYQQPQIIKSYGLEFTRSNGIRFLNGLSLGLLLTLSLFILEGILGWLTFTNPPVFLLRIIAEGFLSAVLVATAEELVFRGWLLAELQRDYNLKISLWLNSFSFAVLHFIKPIPEIIRTFPQFPALVLLGLTLVWAKRSQQGKLGLSIGIHGGLIWGYYIINVGGLITYTNQVSPWVTGVDKNPLAGAMGLLFLSILAWYIRNKKIRE